MTVAQLIEELSKFHPASMVGVWDMGYGGINRAVFVEVDLDDEGSVVAIGARAEQRLTSQPRPA